MVATEPCSGVDTTSAPVEVAPSVGTAVVFDASRRAGTVGRMRAVATVGTGESVVSAAIAGTGAAVVVVGIALTRSLASTIEGVNATVRSLGSATAVDNLGTIPDWRTGGCAVALEAKFSGDEPRFCGAGTIETELAEGPASGVGNAPDAGRGSL